MKTLLKIILTPILSVVIYLIIISPCYLVGLTITEPIEYILAFCLGSVIWVPIAGICYFAYDIINDIIK